jgi:tRNA pseudouridine38-40 synthase
MPRYALKLEYDGTPFAGWQRQTDLATVQGAVEAALRPLQSEAIPKTAAAGRTDAGVHALSQVAHCDMTQTWNPFRLSEALNYHLKPLPIAAVACAAVSDDWHARFSAVERQYVFRLISRRAPLVHDMGKAWQVKKPLELAPMQKAAEYLIGRHDFTTFRASLCQAHSPIKSLDQIEISQRPVLHGVEFRFELRARSFLHSQVRSIVGTLERVGVGAWEPEDVRTALEARDRSACGPVSPPDGLYLSGVRYNTDVF